jgi:hypothetical protein
MVPIKIIYIYLLHKPFTCSSFRNCMRTPFSTFFASFSRITRLALTDIFSVLSVLSVFKLQPMTIRLCRS